MNDQLPPGKIWDAEDKKLRRVIVALLFTIFPAGAALLWNSESFYRREKVLLTIGSLVYFVALAVGVLWMMVAHSEKLAS